MSTPIADFGTVCFDEFEADLHSGELLKAGIKLKLEGQPFQVLAILLARPGELVTRDELRKELWPDDTFVDFEQGINAAVKRLRAALEDSAEKPRLIETLPRRGYRFIGRIKRRPNTIPFPANHDRLELTRGPRNTIPKLTLVIRRATTRRLVVAVGLMAVVAGVLLAVGLNLRGLRDRLLGRPKAGEISSIAVLPLDNLTGDPKQQYFVDGMTEALITELGKIGNLRVASRYSAMAFKDVRKPLPEIAHQLGVDAVLEGSVARNGDHISITARVVQVMPSSQERVLLTEDYERDLSEIRLLQRQIVLAVADEIHGKLVSQEQARAVNPRAYEEYLQGRFLQARRTPDDMRNALVRFQQALKIDPSYIPAYVGIVDCYSIGGGRQMGVSIKEADTKMREAAGKIVELDADSAAGHYAQAMVKWHDWDFANAEKQFRLSLQLNPGDVQVRQHYAHYLLSAGRPVDARHEIQDALDRDPLSAMLTVDIGHAYHHSRQYPEAIQQVQKALKMQKDFPYALMLLSSLYWEQGRFQEALDAGWPIPFRPEDNRRAKEMYARAGKTAMLRWFAEDAERQNPKGDFYARSSWVATWFVRLGDKEKALAWLEKAYEEHDPWLPMDLSGPSYDTISADPRFQDLLRRVGLHTERPFVRLAAPVR